MAAPAKKFGVGVIGYGLSAKVFHIPYIDASPSFELRAIVQRSGSSAKKDHPDCTVYQDPDEMVKDPAVDVVVISTPVWTHFEMIVKAITAGKDVIAEKPFVPTSAEADKLIALAEKHKVVLGVFQNRRWDADFLTLQSVLNSGALGRVVEFETHFDRYSPVTKPKWAGKASEPGSDAIYDLGTHLMDQVVTLYGMPERLTAFLGHQRSGSASANDPQDSFTVLLHYKSGLVATAKASVLSVDTQQLRYWVRGDLGSFRKYHLDPQEVQLQAGMKFTDPDFAKEDASCHGTLTVFKDGKAQANVYPTLPPVTYSKYYELFAAALEGKGPIPVTAAEARDVLRLIELAQKSSKEGVTVTV